MLIRMCMQRYEGDFAVLVYTVLDVNVRCLREHCVRICISKHVTLEDVAMHMKPFY